MTRRGPLAGGRATLPQHRNQEKEREMAYWIIGIVLMTLLTVDEIIHV